jgi:hypothetical protein
MLFTLDYKYRLEVHWTSVEYIEGECRLKDAYFTGPVLKLAEQIQPNDFIMLDFYKQYFIVVENVYIAKLSWEQIKYKDNKIYLNNCKLTHDTEINKAPKLKAIDYMVIDCKNHEEETHSFFPNYKTHIINLDTQVYTYES